MIFSSPEYVVFLVLVALVVASTASASARKLVLLSASYLFYATWDWRCTPLLLATTLANFYLALGIARAQATTKDKADGSIGPTPRQGQLHLWLALGISLGILAYFKYLNFFIHSTNALLAYVDWEMATQAIVLPAGISFFTFKAMSYTIDVYRGQRAPTNRLIDFALYVAFFPQLVAGPIARAGELLPQVERPPGPSGTNVWAGIQIFLVGLFKKLILADAVAPFVGEVFANAWYYSPLTVWLAVVAYAIQIYGDFSGYSDMAIGSARILGFQTSPNFFMPYLSTSITEFWRRWHITLSHWLRDYLYISLGGNRHGQVRTHVNLVLTMLLGGLWHGASWNFVIWGGLHGLGLVAHKLWLGGRSEGRERGRSEERGRSGELGGEKIETGVDRTSAIPTALAWLLTMLLVCLLWVPFRATTLGETMGVYHKLAFLDAGGATWYFTDALVALGWMIVGHAVGRTRGTRELVFFSDPLTYRAALATWAVVLYILLFAPTNSSPFIYAQF